MELFRCLMKDSLWRIHMKNSYRLSNGAFGRETEDEKVKPQKIIFLSAEGNETEREYFDGISSHRKALGINGLINVHVLRRRSKDTNSAPRQVIELLEEYLALRNSNEEIIDDIPGDIVSKYGEDFVRHYLDNDGSLTKAEINRFTTDLFKMGYDIHYRQYLKSHNNGEDEFAILIDRDAQTHSKSNMLECIQYCKEKHYTFYVVNPCFEFWLLLHLCDVKQEYSERLNDIKENKKVSSKHTFVSKELSSKAHHGKDNIHFKQNYLPYVNKAIERAKEFACNEDELIDNIGTNVWKLIERLKSFNND